MEEASGQHLPKGTTLGDRYRIKRVLGEGGFGVTYLAHDDLLTVDVVIKEYLPQEFSVREAGSRSVRPFTHRVRTYGEGLEKFLEEARAVARLNHPNIVRVSNFLEENGTAYFVMDHEEGEALDRSLARSGGKLPVPEVSPLLESLLGALEAVHGSDLLHRDIKPANIFMRKDRGPLLIDFGAARSVLVGHSRSISAIISPGYAPPEQYASASGQGPWTDLYALGATLYHCLVGVAPVESIERSRRVVDGDADPLEPLTGTVVGREAPRVAAVVDAMLMLSAKNRPQSVAEARRHLIAVSGGGRAHPFAGATRIVADGEHIGPPVGAPPSAPTRVVRDDERFGPGEGKGKSESRLEPKPRPEPKARSKPEPKPKAKSASKGKSVSLPAAPGCPKKPTAGSAGGADRVIPAPKADPAIRERRSALWGSLVLLLVWGGLVLLAVMGLPELRVWLDERPATVEPEMVRIEGGCFEIGSPTGEQGRDDDERQHQVCVEDFRLGKYEVTVGEFGKFVSATGYRTDAEKNAYDSQGCQSIDHDADEFWGWRPDRSWRNPYKHQGNRDDHAVSCVSWNDALAYIEWLNRETRGGYRLPTEAEWEYAARGGTTTSRYWGDDPNAACEHDNVADRTKRENGTQWSPRHGCSDGHAYVAPVGKYRANGYGLHDMLGNVWEWTCSAYDEKYGGSETRCASKGSSADLAVRGGSWGSTPNQVRSASRLRGHPGGRASAIGFRLSRID